MKKEPEIDNRERYLLTYGDLMNLLLILFIVLFCVSKRDVVRTHDVMNSIRNGFTGGTPQSSAVAAAGNTGKVGKNAKGVKGTTDYSDFYDQLINVMKQKGVLNKVDITASSDEVIISLKDNVLFAQSKADVSPDARSLLTTIGGLMTKISYGQLIVEGHTDSDPIHTAQFYNNRVLSVMRACNVAQIFEDCGLDSKKLLPVGYGENFPVAKNDTPENKAKNRRVVITILRKAINPSDKSVTTGEMIKTMQDAARGKIASSSAS